MAEERILVCVTDQPQCSRLIHQGREWANQKGARLQVLHVRTRQKTMMGNPDIGAALNQLYADARAADAEMEIISSAEVEKTIADYARSQQVTGVVIGASPRDGSMPMAERLEALLPGVEILTVRNV